MSTQHQAMSYDVVNIRLTTMLWALASVCIANKTYYDGPRVNNDLYLTSQCGGMKWYGTLDEAQARCNMDPSCGWLHDTNCDAKEWRACGEEGTAFASLYQTSPPWETDACTKVTTPYPKAYYDGTVPPPVPSVFNVCFCLIFSNNNTDYSVARRFGFEW